MTILGKLALPALAAALLLGFGPARAAGEEQQRLVDRAVQVLEDVKSDLQFGNAPQLLRQAKAVMVVPDLVKIGFLLGGEGGGGVLLARRPDGEWSEPAFYTIAAASFGLQICVEAAEVVFFVMNSKALQAWMTNQVKLGAKAGLTVLLVGSNAEAAITTAAGVDVIAWARAKGAYAGVTLEGSAIEPRKDWNEAYYGRPIDPHEILSLGEAEPRTAQLRQALDGR
jgi:lipid-binding SYLF domain-containing protein